MFVFHVLQVLFILYSWAYLYTQQVCCYMLFTVVANIYWGTASMNISSHSGLKYHVIHAYNFIYAYWHLHSTFKKHYDLKNSLSPYGF